MMRVRQLLAASGAHCACSLLETPRTHWLALCSLTLGLAAPPALDFGDPTWESRFHKTADLTAM